MTSAEILTLEMELNIAIRFAGEADANDADVEATGKATSRSQAAAHSAGGAPLELTVSKSSLSWFPILVRLRDLRLSATVRVTLDLGLNKVYIALMPSPEVQVFMRP